METIVGFVAGYLVGTREGKDGLERMRSSWHSITTSPEVRKLAADAITLVEAAVRQRSGRASIGSLGNVTEMLVRRAVSAREGRAA
jgi:hypothetical protein